MHLYPCLFIFLCYNFDETIFIIILCILVTKYIVIQFFTYHLSSVVHNATLSYCSLGNDTYGCSKRYKRFLTLIRWSRDMILAFGARGPGFKSRTRTSFFIHFQDTDVHVPLRIFLS